MDTHEMITDMDHGRHVYKQVTLKGGAEVFVNFSEMSKCKKCGAVIWWATTKKARSMPICKDTDGQWMSHFSNCKFAKHFRNALNPGAGDRLDDINRQQTREKW